jgi:hypothetical protein
VKIVKAQKKIDNLTAFFALSGSELVKSASRERLMKLTSGFAGSCSPDYILSASVLPVNSLWGHSNNILAYFITP